MIREFWVGKVAVGLEGCHNIYLTCQSLNGMGENLNH